MQINEIVGIFLGKGIAYCMVVRMLFYPHIWVALLQVFVTVSFVFVRMQTTNMRFEWIVNTMRIRRLSNTCAKNTDGNQFAYANEWRFFSLANINLPKCELCASVYRRFVEYFNLATGVINFDRFNIDKWLAQQVDLSNHVRFYRNSIGWTQHRWNLIWAAETEHHIIYHK